MSIEKKSDVYNSFEPRDKANPIKSKSRILIYGFIFRSMLKPATHFSQTIVTFHISVEKKAMPTKIFVLVLLLGLMVLIRHLFAPFF